MMARWISFLLCSGALVVSGCCCLGNPGACHSGACGPCESVARSCCCLPKPIIWCGNQNECGASDCESCACPDCGLGPLWRWNKSCGKGCGEIYMGEWISDPPDCCDPCDQCYGQWTGPHGCCYLGPMQRLLAALHGHKYCPKPNCGEWCGGRCQHPAAQACSCGGVGCDSCGGEHLASGAVTGGPTPAEVYYEPAQGQSIMTENWDRPAGPKPAPGKPMHKAQQSGPYKVGRTGESSSAEQPVYGRMVRTAGNYGR